MDFSGSGELEVDLGRLVVLGVAMRTASAAGLGTRAEGFLDNRLNGACASTAFDAAAQAVIDLLGIPRQVRRRAHRVTDIVVGQDVAGTNDHKTAGPIGDASIDLLKAVHGCKKKNRIFKQFQTDARYTLEQV